MSLYENLEPARSTEHSDGGEIVTQHGIVEWLHKGIDRGATHMIVACDTFDYDDYPVYVMSHEDVHEVKAKIESSEMQQVMEVYWLAGDLEEQISKPRSFTYGPR
jgi:hypothetical protein